MKKYIIRTIGALCILAAVAMMFLTSWVQIDGVKRGDMRDLRNGFLDDLAIAEEKMLYDIEIDSVKDDLRDNGLPTTPSKVKGRFKETKQLLEELLNTDVSFNEVLWVAKEMPGYMEDTEALLEIPYIAEDLIQTSGNDEFEITAESMEQTLDETEDFKIIFIAVVGVFILLIALAVASAVTHMLNKVRWIKYIFLFLLVAMVVGVCVGVPMASELIHNESEFIPSVFEDLSLRATIMPYLTAALMLVPVVLDIIFERKKKAAVA